MMMIFLSSAKRDIKDYRNYRTVALICHASKVMFKISQQNFLQEILNIQSGFQKGRGSFGNRYWKSAKQTEKKIDSCLISTVQQSQFIPVGCSTATIIPVVGTDFIICCSPQWERKDWKINIGSQEEQVKYKEHEHKFLHLFCQPVPTV